MHASQASKKDLLVPCGNSTTPIPIVIFVHGIRKNTAALNSYIR